MLLKCGNVVTTATFDMTVIIDRSRSVIFVAVLTVLIEFPCIIQITVCLEQYPNLPEAVPMVFGIGDANYRLLFLYYGAD